MDRIEKRVVVSRPYLGLVSMQVCAVEDATDEEILRVCNSENPSGTTMGWSVVVRDGESTLGPTAAPVHCADYPDRIHFVVYC